MRSREDTAQGRPLRAERSSRPSPAARGHISAHACLTDGAGLRPAG